MISYDEAFALSLSFNLWSCMDTLHRFFPYSCEKQDEARWSNATMQGRATEKKEYRKLVSPDNVIRLYYPQSNLGGD